MKISRGERIFDIFNVVFLAVLTITMLYPMWNVFITSVVSEKEYFTSSFILWPQKPYFDSYKYIFSTQQFISAFNVTAFITVAGTLYNMFLTSTLAYGMVKPKFPGKKFFMHLMIITMYFGGGLIPYYLLIRNLGLFDNILVMILPTGFSVYYMFVMKTFFENIPKELLESARIDGAHEFTIFARIILPMSLAPAAALSLFYAVGHWNQWWACLLFINDEKLYTLQMILRKFVVERVESADAAMQLQFIQNTGVGKQNLFTEGIKMATVIVATVPILVVYPFLQKYFAKGVLIGSVKA